MINTKKVALSRCVFDFKEVSIDTYTEALKGLFDEDVFSALLQKRNRLAKSSVNLKDASPELKNIKRVIEQNDRILADKIYQSLIMANISTPEVCDFIPFSTMLKYYVDYDRNGIKEEVNNLAYSLDKITFVADMLESLLTDVKSRMNKIFNGNAQFNQFDSVNLVLKQLTGFFGNARNAENEVPEVSQLFMDYADSINAYLDKRLKTFSDKYRKWHPFVKPYTSEDMIAALNQFFGTQDAFGPNVIKHTASNGSYIDCMALFMNLSPEQVEKIDGIFSPDDISEANVEKYSFAFTDAIMKEYKPQ